MSSITGKNTTPNNRLAFFEQGKRQRRQGIGGVPLKRMRQSLGASPFLTREAL